MEFEKRGQRWQDTLNPGDKVDVYLWSLASGRVVAGYVEESTVKSVDGDTITTLDGAVFGKDSRIAVDPLGAGGFMELVPTLDDEEVREILSPEDEEDIGEEIPGTLYRLRIS